MGRLGVAVVVAWLIFDRVAAATGSVRGEAGGLVALVVLAVVLALDRALLGRGWRESPPSLGVGRPSSRGVLAAAAMGLVLAFFALYARATGARLVEPQPALPMGLPRMAACMAVPWLTFVVRFSARPGEAPARPATGA